jgi:starch phosphorylase
MLAEYLERMYLPAAESHWQRTGESLKTARELSDWYRQLSRHWQQIHWGNVERTSEPDGQVVRAQVYLGDIAPEHVRVQLFAENGAGAPPDCLDMQRDHALSGAAGGFLYSAHVPPDGASRQYTPRVVAWNPRARLPAEANFIRWYPQ